VSRRYVDYEPEMYSPTIVRARDVKLKQGSKADAVLENPLAVAMIQDINDRAMETYNDLLKLGTAPEVARTVLPQGMYTEFIETGSLAAYARLCGLRLDPAAQLEIRQFADAVKTLLMDKFPVSWAALMRDEATAAPPLPPSPSPLPRPYASLPEEPLNLLSEKTNGC